jgi:hypothetical protein
MLLINHSTEFKEFISSRLFLNVLVSAALRAAETSTRVWRAARATLWCKI